MPRGESCRAMSDAAEKNKLPPHALRPEQYAALIAWADDCSWQKEEAAHAVAQELRDRLRPAAPPITWGWSTDPDPEYWSIGDDGEGFATREAALAAARVEPGFDWADELWLVTGARGRPSAAVPTCDTIDVGQYMEDFIADNYGGDFAEGWPEISRAAEVVLDELLKAWADRWLEPLPWRATGVPVPAGMPRPHRMDAPGGPVCGCGQPSRHESGWCGSCQGGGS